MTGIVLRKVVVSGLPYARYRDDLREDFCWSCAYCSITELEARGLQFQIDHHVPQASGGSDDYDNLFYACDRCNRNKDAVDPSPAMRNAGIRYVRVDQDDPREHVQASGVQVDEVTHLTAPGEFTIKVIDLNRRPLKSIREMRRRLSRADDVIVHGLRVLLNLKIDQLPPSARAEVMRSRQALSEGHEALGTQMRSVLERLSASPLLAPDPEREARLRERKRYLNEVGAVGVPQ